MNNRVVTTTPKHEAAYQDMVKLLRRHQHLGAEAMLAIAANMVGKLMALQDQRTMTPERALAIVSTNIEACNAQALAEVMSAGGLRQ